MNTNNVLNHENKLYIDRDSKKEEMDILKDQIEFLENEIKKLALEIKTLEDNKSGYKKEYNKRKFNILSTKLSLKKESKISNAFSASRSSASRKNSQFPFACWIPAFLADETPPFSLRITRILSFFSAKGSTLR